MGPADAAPFVEFFMNVLGQSRADAEHNAAKMVQEGAFADIQNIIPPELQLAELYEQGPAEISKFAEDPRLRDAQLKALEGLGREVDFRGLTPEDIAANQRVAGETGRMEAGFRGAAQQSAAQRGMASSTGAYLGDLSAGQAATNRASAAGTENAAAARQRYLAALEGLGGMGAQVRGQDFGIAGQRASAQDAINRFNVGQRSATQAYNLGVPQQDFENQMGLGRLGLSAAAQYADEFNRRGERASATAAKWGAATNKLMNGMGGGGGGGFGGGGGGGFPF